jgi:hypothetical protein
MNFRVSAGGYKQNDLVLIDSFAVLTDGFVIRRVPFPLHLHLISIGASAR